jgi:HK97 family phage prohead protease
VSFELPIDQFIRPVAGDDDVLAFRYDFTLEGKAVDEAVVTETEDGDLIIEGYAAVFEGVDRENENFTEDAFDRGITSFLGGQAALCYHHKHDKCLGKVLDLRKEEGKGLKMRARVDGAIKNHPELGTIYQQIKRGTLNALSVGGFFRRKMTEAGRRISDMDFTEISITPVPVHPGTNFAVVAGKALASDLKVPDGVTAPSLPEDEIRDDDFLTIQYALEALGSVVERLEKRGNGSEPSAADTVVG